MGGFPIPGADGISVDRIQLNGDSAQYVGGDGACHVIPGGNGVVVKATVTLTTAQLLAMRATPVTLVAAQGNGTAIKVVALYAEFRAATTPYTIPAGAQAKIDMAANPTDFTFNMALSGFIDQVSNQVQSFTQTSDVFGPSTDVNNSAIEISLTGGVGELTLGDGSLRINTYYVVVAIDPIII